MNHIIGNVLIRPLEEDDVSKAESFLRFINEIIRETSAKTSFFRERNIDEEIGWLKKALTLHQHKKMLQMVALKHKEIVGMCDITLLEERKSHVGDFGIALLRHYRAKGFGRKLAELTIEEGIQFFGERLKVLRVCFPASKTRVRTFYELLGFVAVAIIPDQYLFDTFEPEIIMLRQLTKETR